MDDAFKGTNESIQNLEEQIKAFNKKLANTKTDTNIIWKSKNDEISSRLNMFHNEINEIGELLTKRSNGALAQDELAGIAESNRPSARGSSQNSNEMDTRDHKSQSEMCI